MNEALANPEYGYYRKKDPFGKDGDFTTAPEISQIFGELIGIWCASVWQEMGSPNDLQIAEIGAGRGTLMRDFLRGTKHISGFHDSFEIAIIDTSPVLQQIQQQKLAGCHKKISWHDDIGQIAAKPMILVANELFDALPVNQYIRQTGKWYERNVGLDTDGNLAFFASRHAIGIFNDKYPDAKDGAILEICPDAISLMEKISSHIKKHNGAAVIIDYGYTENSYNDTLQAVKNHKYHHVLKDIGDADLTAHVDFVALASASALPADISTQRNFLLSLGIEARGQMLMKNADDNQKKDIESAIERLIGEEEMGNLFKVLTIRQL